MSTRSEPGKSPAPEPGGRQDARFLLHPSRQAYRRDRFSGAPRQEKQGLTDFPGRSDNNVTLLLFGQKTHGLFPLPDVMK